MKQRIGFVGVGLMGGWLARHLLAAGYSVTAHDIDAAKVEAIVQAGGKKAGAPTRSRRRWMSSSCRCPIHTSSTTS